MSAKSAPILSSPNTNLETSSFSSDPSSLPIWDRLSTWASENKAVVYTIAGAAVIVSGAGVAYYLSDSRKNTRAGEEKKRLSKKERRKAKQEKDREAGKLDPKPAPEQPRESKQQDPHHSYSMLTSCQHNLELPKSSQIHWKAYHR